jgi:ATP-dependent helicase HrpB
LSGSGPFRRSGLDPLPIDDAIPELVQALAAEGAVGVLSAPPGSGKTTRLPPAIVDHVPGFEGEVVVLEPRRVAARAAARRVASERGSRVGDEIGYQVRHDRKVSARTRVRFVTEGVLLRQLLADPFLEGVGAVVLDEFHERHLEGDLALAMLREVRATVRPDLRLVVMSATLDATPILTYLAGGTGQAASAQEAGEGGVSGEGPADGAGGPTANEAGGASAASVRMEAVHASTGGTPSGDRLAERSPGDEALSGPRPFHVEASGRMHPVTVRYQERPDDRRLDERAADLVRDGLGAMRDGEVPRGDVLVFLPGVGEIRALTERLGRGATGQGGAVRVLPLHGTLDAEAQDAALRPSGPGEPTKIVLATNLAESSLTIPGVTLVIDSGLARVPRHDSGRGIDVLELVRISRASAEQRAGRAGRTAPGACWRMWTRADDRSLLARDVAEIRRVDLAGAVLQVRAFTGGREPAEFGWFEAPAPGGLERADALLRALGAVGADGRPTSIGERMLAMPLHPRLARARLAAEGLGAEVVRDTALAAAMLAERPLIPALRPGGSGSNTGASAPSVDLEEWLRRFDRARDDGFDGRTCSSLGIDRRAAQGIDRVWRQLVGGSRRRGAGGRAGGRGGDEIVGDLEDEFWSFDGEDSDEVFAPGADAGGVRGSNTRMDALARALLAGFPDRLARVDPGGLVEGRDGPTLNATMPGSRGVRLEDPVLASALADEEPGLFLVLAVRDPAAGGGGGGARGAGNAARGRVELALHVDLGVLPKAERATTADAVLVEESAAVFDADRGGALRGVRRLRFLDLVLRERGSGAVDPVLAAERLAAELRADPERWLGPNEGLARLRTRLAWLASVEPGLGIPAEVSWSDLAAALEDSLAGVRRLADLQEDAGLADTVVHALLTQEQARAARERAPDRIELPSGRRAEVQYEVGREPTIAVRMQELFGLTATPRLGRNGPALRLELLGPNFRAVQITTDLASFWQNHWPSVRAELKRRYPKHSWPEDPRTAEPLKVGGRGRGRRRG